MNKTTCTNCRRTYNATLDFCPFCGSENKVKAVTLPEEATLDNHAYQAPKTATPKKEKAPVQKERIESVSPEPMTSATDTTASSETNGNEQLHDASNKRKKIPWSDETVVEEQNPLNGIEDGKYNPNFDHYYDDVKLKIDGEIETLTLGKEKAILKVIASFLGVIGVIVYLIVSL